MKMTPLVLSCLMALAACSQPRAAVQASNGQGAKQDHVGAESLCRDDEIALFSCRVTGSAKLASLCASKGISANEGHIYYAFGTLAKVELRHPQGQRASQGMFQRTHLVYAGPTGAFAYSFMRAGVQYVMYSISGANGFERQGVLAYHPGALEPLADLKCAEGTVVEAEDSTLTDLTLTWPENPELAEHGLPF